MSAQHWLAGYNVPPFLEALPAPQPAPAVQWDRSSAAVVPSTAATPLAAATPPAALSATPSASPSATPPAAPAAVSSPQPEPSEADPSGSTPSNTSAGVVDTPPDPQQDSTAAVEIVSEENSALERAVSAPAGPSVSGEGREAGGEGKEEGDATAPIERSASAGSNWRGSGPKIKASRALQSFDFVLCFVLTSGVCDMYHLRQNG